MKNSSRRPVAIDHEEIEAERPGLKKYLLRERYLSATDANGESTVCVTSVSVPRDIDFVDAAKRSLAFRVYSEFGTPDRYDKHVDMKNPEKGIHLALFTTNYRDGSSIEQSVQYSLKPTAPPNENRSSNESLLDSVWFWLFLVVANAVFSIALAVYVSRNSGLNGALSIGAGIVTFALTVAVVHILQITVLKVWRDSEK